MKYHKPSFFDQFKCIGSACTDTCCAGWEIEVDETTAEGYLTEKDAFVIRLPEMYFIAAEAMLQTNKQTAVDLHPISCQTKQVHGILTEHHI